MKDTSRKAAKAVYGKGYSTLDKQILNVGSRRLTLFRRGDQLRPKGEDLPAAVARGVWYFKFRVEGKKNDYKESLKTNSLREAKKLAEDRYLELLSEIKSGHQIQSLNLGDVFRQYSKHLDDQVRRGQKRPSTLKNIHCRLGHGKRFLHQKLSLALNTKVSTVDGNLWNQYLTWREEEVRGKTKNQASLSMIRDELLVIRAMFRWAYEKKLSSERAIPRWDTFKTPEPKRERVTFEQYNQVVRILNTWSSVKESDSPRDAYYKQMVRHAFFTISNCGLRSGELFGLKNKDLTIDGEQQLVTIRVRADTSKKGKDRNTTLSARKYDDGSYVNHLVRWIKDHAIHKGENDFVFADFENGTSKSKIYPAHSAAREKFYKLYRFGFRAALKAKDLDWFDLYHCRHIYISYRLRDDKNPYMVAKAVGTSLYQIEKTYDNIQAELASLEIQKDIGKNKNNR